MTITTITGVVSNGVIVPSSPLPEGARVEIQLRSAKPEVPAEKTRGSGSDRTY